MRQILKSHGASLISRFTIILLGLLLISILSITTLWFIDTKTQIETRFEIQQNQSVIWIDGGIRLYEYSYEPGLRDAMSQYLKAYTTSRGDIDAIDLLLLKEHYNQTIGGVWDLYIINAEGGVEKTTYAPDAALNFSEYPGFYKTLTHIRENEEYVVDRTVKGFIKGAPNRKFAYQGTPDKKYILELSRNFEKFIPSETETSYTELLQNLPQLNQNIVAVER